MPSARIQTRFNEQQVVDNNYNFNNIIIESADQYQSFYMAWAEVSIKPMTPRTYRLSPINGVNLKYRFKRNIILNTSHTYINNKLIAKANLNITSNCIGNL